MSAQEPSNTTSANEQENKQQRLSEQPQQDNKTPAQFISLLNFNPSSKARPVITSPRSIEALRRVGFEDFELLYKTKEEFLNEPVPAEFADDKAYYCEVKAEHYEKRRKEKLKAALQERDKVIKEEIKKTSNTAYSSQFGQDNHDKTYDSSSRSQYGNFGDTGMRKLQQMKNQQKKEIEFIIQNDLKVQEMYKKNEEKLAKMEELEKKRKQELEIKIREAEFAKKKREAQRIEREKEQEELSKALEIRQKMEEQRRKEVQDKLSHDRHVEAIEKEKERREKSLMRELKMEEMEALKREYAEKQKEERDLKLARIKEEADEKQRAKQRQSEHARKTFEFKISVTRKKYEDEREEQRRKAVERQNQTISKREKAEEEKRNQLDMRRNRSEAKLQEIRKTLDEKHEQEQAKKMAYLERYKKAEENKKTRDQELEEQRLMKIQKENEKMQKLKQVLSEYQSETQKHNDMFLKTISQDQFRAEKQKEQLLKDLKRKYILDALKMEDAEENNKRLERLQEEKRNYLSEKISASTQKVQQLQAEKEKAFLEKRKLESKLEAEKALVLSDFEKKKKLIMTNKLSVESLAGELKQDKQESSFQSPVPINKPVIQTTKSQPKLMPYQLKPGTKSAKNLAMNKTTYVESNDVISNNLFVVDQPSRSLLSMNLERNKSNQSHYDIRAKKDNSMLPKNLRESPYNRSNRVMNSTIKDNKTVMKLVNASMPHKDDIVLLDLQSPQYKKAIGETRKEQLDEILGMVDQALKEDKDGKKIGRNIEMILDQSKKQQEETAKIRQQNNYLVFA